MANNKYLKRISAAGGFISEHFRMIVFMSFMVFLFYIAMLGVDIVSAINHIPSTEDINKKMLSINIRKDLIKKIDNFISMRQKETNVQIIGKNPFLPYQKGPDNNSANEPAVSPEIPGVQPSVSPSVAPTAFPSISSASPSPEMMP